jgi:hypothetical protein
VVVAAHDLLPDRLLQPPLRPRLAFCLSLAGPGSREFPFPTTRRRGAFGISREQSRFHQIMTSRPMPVGAWLFAYCLG